MGSIAAFSLDHLAVLLFPQACFTAAVAEESSASGIYDEKGTFKKHDVFLEEIYSLKYLRVIEISQLVDILYSCTMM